MINFHKLRLAVLTASISAALMLSACQPANDEVAAVPVEEAMPDDANHEGMDAATDPHAGMDMSGDAMATNATPLTAMHKEYAESMTTMHEEMMKGMAYNDPDTAFAQGMLGHHIGAVDMAEIELDYGEDAQMLKLAQQIIDAQKVEINQMQTWLASHPDSAEPTPDTEAMQMAYAQGMDTMHGEMMEGIADPIPDLAFARGMLPHHVGAVDMAKVQLKYGKDAEMLKLAQEIIDAQKPEIELMQSWIAEHKV